MGEQRLQFQWDKTAAKDILAFGVGMFASSATYFLAGEAERLVVGKFVTLVVLGYFSLALSIALAATSGLQKLIGQVFYPIIAASVRADRVLAAEHFRKVRLLLLVVSAGMAITFIAGGHFIVAILLGPKYAPVGWMLQLLGFRAALDLFTSATTQMLFALGTSKYAAQGNIAKLIVLAVGMGIAFGKFGFYQAVWVLAISSLFAYIPLLIGIKNHFRDVLGSELTTCSLFLASAGLAALVTRLFV
jgi:O-antigen/teichoic acid export membrane protein